MDHKTEDSRVPVSGKYNLIPLKHWNKSHIISESVDSVEKCILSNVEKLLTPPPKDGGKTKKGHLCFDAAFETGNLP